jgi:hypothetical protein
LTTVKTDFNLHNATLKVYGVGGQQILEQANLQGDNFSFDISKQVNGIYILEVINNGYISRTKIIKK